MDGEFSTMLVAACSGGARGNMSKAEFTAAVKDVADAAVRQDNVKHVIRSIYETIEAARCDENLNMQAAIFVVDSIWHVAGVSLRDTADVNNKRSQRLAEALSRHAPGWLQTSVLHQKSTCGFSKVKEIMARWQRRGWLSDANHLKLLDILNEAEKDGISRGTVAVVPVRRLSRSSASRDSLDSNKSGLSPEQTKSDRAVSSSSQPHDSPATAELTSASAFSQSPGQATPVKVGSTSSASDGSVAAVTKPQRSTDSLSNAVANSPSRPPLKRLRRNSASSEDLPVSSVEEAHVSTGARQASKALCSSSMADRPATPPRSPNEAKRCLISRAKAAVTRVLNGHIPQPDIWKVYGDCRCLFRSICRGCDDPLNKIARDEKGRPVEEAACRHERERADDLRAQLCLAMWRNQEEVAKQLGGEVCVKEYITRMEDWRTWGDAICLSFLPDLIGCPIQVYALNTVKKCVFDSGMHLPKDASLQGEPVIVLWYNGKSHYDLVSTRWLMAWERALYNSAKLETS